MKNARHAYDPRPLDETCSCSACSHYSRAYLHHLFKAEEVLGLMLLTQHNITYYQHLTAAIRTAIDNGQFADFADQFYETRTLGDIPAING